MKIYSFIMSYWIGRERLENHVDSNFIFRKDVNEVMKSCTSL